MIAVRTSRCLLVSLIALVGLGYGAHSFGVREGNRARGGSPVNLDLLGLHISSISAIPSDAYSIVSSNTVTLLVSHQCLMVLGLPADSTLLYYPHTRATISLPSSSIVLIPRANCESQ